jgi:uncharacterized membrane protein YuzA (DUF378 family)
MKKMGAFSWIVVILVIVGGLNWGLVGFFKYNLVEAVFGKASMASRIIYDLVGLAALYMLYWKTMGSEKSE